MIILNAKQTDTHASVDFLGANGSGYRAAVARNFGGSWTFDFQAHGVPRPFDNCGTQCESRDQAAQMAAATVLGEVAR